MRILIVEDEKKYYDMIENAVLILFEQTTIHKATSYSEGEELLRNFEYDLITIDFHLPDGTGIDLVNQFIETFKDRKCFWLFLTAELDYKYAFEAFNTYGVSKVLHKPFSSDMLKQVILDLFRKNSRYDDDYFKFSNREMKLSINYSQIVYFEYNLRRCYLQSDRNKYDLGRYSIKNLIAELPYNFIQVHKSFIINTLRTFAYYEESREIVVDDYIIPVGEKYKQNIDKVLFNDVK